MPTLEDDKVKREDQIDQRAQEMFSNHPDLQERENKAGRQSNESTLDNQDNSNAKTEANAGWVNNTSTNPGEKQSLSRGQKIIQFGKKNGAPLSITGVLIGLAFGAGSFFPLLPLHVLNTLMNYNDSEGRTSNIVYKKITKYRMDKKIDKACKNPSSKACAAKTIGPNEKKRLKQAGWDVKGGTVGGRTVMTELTSPPDENGKRQKITSSADLNRQLAGSSHLRSSYQSATDPRFSSFGSRFRGAVAKFGVLFKKSKITGVDSEEKSKKFREQAGIKEGSALSEDFKSQRGSKIKSGVKLGSKINYLASACVAYNTTRAVLTAVKIYNGIEYMKFFANFAVKATSIKQEAVEKDSADPETIEFLGDMLTSAALSGNNKGLTATDSQGYKAAAYGDRGRLQNFTTNMLLGGGVGMITLDKTVKALQDKVGKKNIRTACKTATDPASVVFLMGAACASEAGAAAAAGTILPGAGTVAGGGVGLVGCALKAAAGVLLGAVVIGKVINKAIEYGAGALKDANITTNLIGTQVGDALAIGANLLMNTKSGLSGLFAGTSGAVNNFMAATEGSEREYIEGQKYLARDTPFDISNQYSFLGSLVHSTGFIENGLKPASVLSFVGSSINPVASAEFTPYGSNSGFSTDNCLSEEQKDMKIVCDIVGNTRAVTSPKSLLLDGDAIMDYMSNKNQADTYDGDGTPIPGSDYEKWVNYCIGREPSAIGDTEAPVEDKDYYWKNGANCTRGENLDGDNNITTEQRDYFEAYQSLINNITDAEADPDDVAGSTENTGGGTEFIMATNNIKVDQRKAVEYMKTADVIATQELESAGEYKSVSQGMDAGNFGVYPDYSQSDLKGINRSRNSMMARSIFYNRDKFEINESKSTFFRVPRNYDSAQKLGDEEVEKGKANVPVLWLTDKATGQEIVVLNTHGPAGRKQAGQRLVGADKYVEEIGKLREENPTIPVFFGGDFNEFYSATNRSNSTKDGNYKNVLFCKFAENKLMREVEAVFEEGAKAMHCPRGIGDGVQHIYITPDVDIIDYDEVPKQRAGSDHPQMKARLSVKGTGLQGTGGSFTIGSYNMCDEGIHSNCPSGNDLTKKTALITDVISGNNDDNGKRLNTSELDIIGAQETTPEMQKRIEQALGYDSFPEKFPSKNGVGIFWNPEKFTKTSSGYVTGIKGNGSSDNIDQRRHPWVELQAESGQKIAIVSSHSPRAPFGTAADRHNNAKKYLEWAKSKAVDNTIAIITGDFNISGPKDEGPSAYCIITEGGSMRFARDTAEGKQGNCSSSSVPRDLIFGSTNIEGLTVSNWEYIDNDAAGTDHSPAIATYKIPGQGGGLVSCSNVNQAPPNIFTIVPYQGEKTDQRTLSLVKTADDCLKQAGQPSIEVIQGSYCAGSCAGASGSSHDKGATLDISTNGKTKQQIDILVTVLRKVGFAAWYRDGSDGFGGNEHIHAVALGAPASGANAPGSPDQIILYCTGGNGLNGGEKDRHLSTIGRPLPQWAVSGSCKRYP